MLHIDINLNTELEQQLLQVVNQKFQGSFDAFIKAGFNALNRELSPIQLNSVTQNGRTLNFKKTLTLQPTTDPDSPDLIIVEDKELNLHAYAINREILMNELAAELFLLWDEYAQETEENLSPKAQQLRKTLLNRCHVEEN